MKLAFCFETTKIRYHYLRIILAFWATVVGFFTGCTGIPVKNDYANDPTDPCVHACENLAAHNDYFAQDIAKGTTAGTGVGGVAALLFADDVWLWAPIVAGAALGAATGYYSAIHSKEGQNPSGFFSSIIKSATEEQQRLLAMTTSVEQLLACRRQEEADIRAAYQDKRIDRATAEQRLAMLRQRVKKDMTMADSIRQGMGAHMGGIQFAAIKSAPEQISYMSMDATYEQVQPQAVSMPQEMQDNLAKAPAAPVPDTAEAQAQQQQMVQSVSQLQDIYKKANSNIDNLSHVATKPLDEGIDGPTSWHTPLPTPRHMFAMPTDAYSMVAVTLGG